MNWTASALRALLVVCVLAAPLAGLTVAQDGENNPDARNATEYSYAELKDGGTLIGGDASPSDRWLGYDGKAYVSYEETNVIRELGMPQPEWAVDKVVGPGSLVDTNTIRLHVNRNRGAEPRTVHLKVVYWQTKTRTIQEGNTTREETVAVNVTEETHAIELASASQVETVELRNHPDKPVRVTMWIEEYPAARWTFKHHSTALAAELPFDPNWGSLLSWLLQWIVGLAAVGALAAVVLARKTVDKVGRGPGKSVGWYVFIAVFAGYALGYFYYGDIARLIVTAPYTLPASVTVMVYFSALEQMSDTDTLVVEELLTSETTNPLGDGVPDIQYERGETYKATERDGRLELFKDDSLRQFLVRAAGAAPASIAISELESRVDYEGFADEKLYSGPDSDELISITWPALSFGIANLREEQTVRPEQWDGDGGTTGAATQEVWDRQGVLAAGVWGFAGFAAGLNLLNPAFGLLVAVGAAMASTAEPVDGNIEFTTAPAHTQPAKARSVTEQTDYAELNTFHQLEEYIADKDVETIERAHNLAEAYVKQMRDELDRMFGAGSDPSDSSGPTGPTGDLPEVPGDD